MNDVFVPDDEQLELAKDFVNGAKMLLMLSQSFCRMHSNWDSCKRF
jgi:hypothetical protein